MSSTNLLIRARLKARIMPNTHRRRRRDETVLSRSSSSSSSSSRQFGNWPNRLRNGLTTWILIDIDNTFFNNDEIMTSLFKNLSISIKIGVIKRQVVCLVSFQIVDRIRRQSSWASCELCSHRRRRRDKTVSSRRRRRCVLGIRYVHQIWQFGRTGRTGGSYFSMKYDFG